MSQVSPSAPETQTTSERTGFPPGIPYIVGNEAAERFSFYGMRAILYVHMADLFMGFPKAGVTVAPEIAASAKVHATEVQHLFMAGVYAFPMIGAILADRLMGKFAVILWVSVLYCAGHAVLSVDCRHEMGMYLGLALIALGSGGIKPCVSANVGDQFTKKNAHLIPIVYQIFYFSINFGSFFATLLIPYLRREYGADVAFAVPGILMAIAAVVFWAGSNKFVKFPPIPGGMLGFYDFIAGTCLFIPFMAFAFFPALSTAPVGPLSDRIHPALIDATIMRWPHWIISAIALVIFYLTFSARQAKKQDDGFLALLFYSIRNQSKRKPGQGFFSVCEDRFGAEAAEGPKAVISIMIVFSMVCVFWALFDQHSSTWIEQATHMNRNVQLFGKNIHFDASQIPSLNPLCVLVMIPVLQITLFGPMARQGKQISPLLRMTVGMFVTSLSFVAVALIQKQIDVQGEGVVHVAWQIIPYAFLTLGEVLVSTTGLEFAYTQAPKAMKSTIMGFWLLCVTIGNLLVAFLAPLQKLSLEKFFWLFAGLMALAAVIFAIQAAFYKGKTYMMDS